LALDDTSSGPQRPLEQPYRDLYAAAAAACLAAFEGQSEKWQEAIGRLERVQRADVSCWEQVIYEITSALIGAYTSDPGTEFQRSSETGFSPCPDLTGLEPSHGPQSGGYEIRIYGENLPESLPLLFGETVVNAVRQSDGSAIVTVPAGNYPGNELILISDAPSRGAARILTFTYDAELTSPSPSATP
jgi:hypothetical protein